LTIKQYKKKVLMKKPIFIATLIIILVIGLLGGIKFLQIKSMIAYGNQFVPGVIFKSCV